MYNLLNVYDCPKCGKILSDQVEMINVQQAEDEWGKLPFCNKCNSEAKIRMRIDPDTKQEVFHYEEVDDERARWAHGYYDENNDDDDDDDFSKALAEFYLAEECIVPALLTLSGDVQERAKEYICSKYGNPVKRGSVSSVDDVYEAYIAGHAGASGELEALKAENERLREALLDIANMTAGKKENGLVIYCNERANKELNKPQQ